MAHRVLGCVFLMIAACSETEPCDVGSEGCSCTRGGACDPGLSCYSDLCVDPGSGGDGDADADGDADQPLVPQPCPDSDIRLSTEAEPNDTPANASDACTARTGEDVDGTYPSGVCPTGTIGPAGVDDVDYFVFRTANGSEDQLVSTAIEWDEATDLLDLQVYEVTEDGLSDAIYTGQNPNAGSEGSYNLSLPGGRTYVLQLQLKEDSGSPVAYFGECHLCEQVDHRSYDCFR